MKTWLIALVGIVLSIYRWLLPSNKWVRKREQYRLKLKEIDDELEETVFQIVEAKKHHDGTLAVGLDRRRERLLAERRKCQSEFQYFSGLADKSR